PVAVRRDLPRVPDRVVAGEEEHLEPTVGVGDDGGRSRVRAPTHLLPTRPRRVRPKLVDVPEVTVGTDREDLHATVPVLADGGRLAERVGTERFERAHHPPDLVAVP